MHGIRPDPLYRAYLGASTPSITPDLLQIQRTASVHIRGFLLSSREYLLINLLLLFQNSA